MRKSLAAAMAAITFGGAVAATAAPAEARPYRGDYYGRRHHNNNDAGVAVAAGVVGLALGAALAGSSSGSRGYYNNGYYGRSYAPGYAYGPGYGYGSSYGYGPSYGYGYAPSYRVCESRERVYDPYIDRRVTIRRQYAC